MFRKLNFSIKIKINHTRNISIKESRKRQQIKKIPIKKIQPNNFGSNLYEERALNAFRIGLQSNDAHLARQQYKCLKNYSINIDEKLKYLTLMSTLKNSTLSITKEIDQIARNLTLDGIIVNQSIFNQILKNYLNLQSGRSMESLFEFLITNHIQINKIQINLLLSHYAKQGPAVSAQKLLDYIIQADLPTTKQYYYYLIDSYGKSGKPWESIKVIEQAEKQGHGLDPQMLTRLLHCFATNAETKGMQNIWNVILEKNITKTTEMYNILINGYKKKRNHQKALEIYKQMKSLGKNSNIKPDHYTISSVIDVYCDMNQAEEASILLQEMLDAGMTVEPYYINTIMASFQKKNDAKVFDFFKYFEKAGLKPDNTTYNILISMYGFQHNLEAVDKILLEMQKNGISLTRYTIGILIRIYFENDQSAKCNEWYQKLQSRGMFPNHKILSTMMRLSALLGETNFSFYYDFGKTLNILTTQMVNEYAVCLMINGKSIKDTQEIVINQLSENNLKPDAKTLWILVDGVIRPRSLKNHLKPFGQAPADIEDIKQIVQGKDGIQKIYNHLVAEKKYIPDTLKKEYTTALFFLK